jgi:hypothetical protein
MRNSIKTTTYSLDWDVVMNLESRMIRDFQRESTSSKGIDLLMISIGSRLGLRVIDNLNLKWEDLIELEVGERFVRIEKKTDKERVLVMSSMRQEVSRRLTVLAEDGRQSWRTKPRKQLV